MKFILLINEFFLALFLPILSFILKRLIGRFFNSEHIKNIKAKYILDTSGDILSLIGFVVFLELIELNFCDFNINLRRKIMDRSEFESISLLEEDFDDNDDDNDNNKGEEDNNCKNIN